MEYNSINHLFLYLFIYSFFSHTHLANSNRYPALQIKATSIRVIGTLKMNIDLLGWWLEIACVDSVV